MSRTWMTVPAESVQAAVYELSKVGQALDGSDFVAAGNVLSSSNKGWITNVEAALSKVNTGHQTRCFLHLVQSFESHALCSPHEPLKGFLFQVSSSSEEQGEAENFSSAIAKLQSAGMWIILHPRAVCRALYGEFFCQSL